MHHSHDLHGLSLSNPGWMSRTSGPQSISCLSSGTWHVNIVGSGLYHHILVIRPQVYMVTLGGSNRWGREGGGYSTLHSPGKSVPTAHTVGFVPFCGVPLSFTNFWFWEWVRFFLPWVLKRELLQNRNINFCNSSPSDLLWLQVFQGQKPFVTVSLDWLTTSLRFGE